MSVETESKLAMAKAAEGRGEAEAAIAHYLKAGQPEDAARLLVAAGRFAEAAQVFMRAAGIAPERLDKDDRERRRLYRNAAVCLARGGDTRRSAELLLRLGDPLKAAEVLERAGDIAGAAHLRAGGKTLPGGGNTIAGAPPAQRSEAGQRLEKDGKLDLALEAYVAARMLGDAARVAHKLGRFSDAARMFEDAGLFAQAAKCWTDAGDKQRALQDLVRVPREHKQYRQSCMRAIALASDMGKLGMELDQFLSRFCGEAPRDNGEVEAFAQLGRLYEKQGFPDNAQEVYRKLLSVQPEHPAGQRLAALANEAKGSNVAYAEIVNDDANFMGRRGGQKKAQPAKQTALPDAAVQWPSLPPLPASQLKPGAPVRSSLSPQAPAPPAHSELLAPDSLQVGQLIAHRYRIEAKIGQGGMAAIFRAFDTELEEEVAIKVFTVPVQEPEMLARFKQELAVARKLSHPNIVRLHDIGVDRGCRFISMELLSGCDMSKLLEQREMPLPEALGLLSQACAGLQCAHDRGVIHRDVKPENFFVTPEGVLKVMDFGIAKNTAVTSQTRTGFLAGTPHYMSPEQIDGFGQVTALTDIYALGIVAYEACTGLLPFCHDEIVPLLMMHKNATPEPPRQHNPQMPESLNRLILRLLEKDPAARMQSCRELGAEFDRIRKHEC